MLCQSTTRFDSAANLSAVSIKIAAVASPSPPTLLSTFFRSGIPGKKNIYAKKECAT